MTRTEHLGLCTWALTDGVDVEQINENFTTLDARCHRGDNFYQLAESASAENRSITAAFTKPEGFSLLEGRFTLLTNQAGNGYARFVAEVTDENGQSTGVLLGVLRHADTRDFLTSGRITLRHVTENLWDLHAEHISGIGNNVFETGHTLKRISLSGLPAAITVRAEKDEQAAVAPTVTGGSLQVFAGR